MRAHSSSEQMTRHMRNSSGARVVCGGAVGLVAFATLFSWFAVAVKSQTAAAPCAPSAFRVGLGPTPPPPTEMRPPTVSLTSPATNATVSGTAVVLSACAADDVGVVGVQFMIDGGNLGSED